MSEKTSYEKLDRTLDLGLEPLPDGPVTACPQCWLTGPCDCGATA